MEDLSSKLNVIFYDKTHYVLIFLAAKPSLDIGWQTLNVDCQNAFE